MSWVGSIARFGGHSWGCGADGLGRCSLFNTGHVILGFLRVRQAGVWSAWGDSKGTLPAAPPASLACLLPIGTSARPTERDKGTREHGSRK